MIGVPSLAITAEGADVSWRLRSVAQAMPLITAARDHTAYHHTTLVQLTGAEQVTGAGVGTTDQTACSGNRAIPEAASAELGVGYARFPIGLDIAMVIDVPGNGTFTVASGGLPQASAAQSSGCFVVHLSAAQLGLALLPAGSYQVQLLGGPGLTPLNVPYNLSVTPSAATPAHKAHRP